MEKNLRKRISYEPKGIPALVDPKAFSPNKCTQNARQIFEEKEIIHIKGYEDKHYHDHAHLGMLKDLFLSQK